MKTVKAKSVQAKAARLFELRRKIDLMSKKLGDLNEEYDLLVGDLRGRYSEGFVSPYKPGTLAVVEFDSHRRLILDQKKVRKILGPKTPMKSINVDVVRLYVESV